jgi:UDP-2,3-diacylglucosamine pyrophosphatase LpxH
MDIPYLLQLGFRVFGVEGVRQAIEELGTENSLEFQYEEGESIYRTEDRRLVIYHGDILTCPIEKWGPFDAVWDRGAFGTVTYEIRQQYIDIVRRGLQGKLC